MAVPVRQVVIDRLQVLCVAWRAAVAKGAAGDAEAVLRELLVFPVTAREVATTNIGRVVTKCSLGALASPTLRDLVDKLRALWKASLADDRALRQLCGQLADYSSLLEGVDAVSVALALHGSGVDGLYALDEADPAMFNAQPAALRQVLCRLIERCTQEGRDAARGSVIFLCPCVCYSFFLSALGRKEVPRRQ